MANPIQNIFQSTVQCKYKNTTIFINKESITSLGQKRIVHDYPGSGQRYLEAMGQVPKEFEVDITFSGLTYQDDFNEFKALLQDPNPGTLVMPTFGIINNVVALPSSAVHNYSEYLCIVMTVKFSETIQQPTPTSIPPTPEDTFNLGNIAWNNIISNLTGGLITPSSINNALTLQRDIVAVVNNITQLIGFSQVAAGYISALAVVTSNPSKITNLLFGIPAGFMSYVYQNNTSANQLSQYASLASVGNNLPTNIYEISQGIIMPTFPLKAGQLQSLSIPFWAGATLEQQQRNNNRFMIINAVRLWALIMMCEAAVTTTFTTVQSVINARNQIDYLFNQIIEQDQTGVLIPWMKQSMEQVQMSAYNNLNQIQGTAFNTQLITLEKSMSAAVLAYELYGEYCNSESDLLNYKNILISLNPSQPQHYFSGSVNVIQIN